MLIWTMPIGLVFSLSAFSVIIQSCSVPIDIRTDGHYVKIENLYTPFIIYGIILLIGTCFSIFTLVQVGKISRKLKELGYSI